MFRGPLSPQFQFYWLVSLQINNLGVDTYWEILVTASTLSFHLIKQNVCFFLCIALRSSKPPRFLSFYSMLWSCRVSFYLTIIYLSFSTSLWMLIFMVCSLNNCAPCWLCSTRESTICSTLWLLRVVSTCFHSWSLFWWLDKKRVTSDIFTILFSQFTPITGRFTWGL